MTSGIVLRDFCPEDQAAARQLILDGLVEHWGWLDPTLNPDLDDIAGHYAGDVVLTAWHGGDLVGIGALVAESEGVGRIVRMSVAATHRRRGIGSRVLEALCDRARALGYRRLVLETTATWDDAIAFYRRHGFHPVGCEDGDMHFERGLA